MRVVFPGERGGNAAAAGDLREVVVFEFDGQGMRMQVAFLYVGKGVLVLREERLIEGGDAFEVVDKGGFAADGFALACGFDGAQVDATRHVVVKVTMFAEGLTQAFRRESQQVGAGFDAKCVHMGGGRLADAVKALNRQ